MLNYFQTSSPLRFSLAGWETLLRAAQGPSKNALQEDLDVSVSGRSPQSGQEKEAEEEREGVG